MTILKYSKGTNDFFTNQLMNQLFRETNGSLQNVLERESTFRLGANVIDEEGQYVIEMAIPGFSKKNVTIKVEDGFLKVAAQKEDDQERNYLKREFSVANLERSFKLSDGIDQENISAEVKDGILLVKLSKLKADEPKSRDIVIR